MQITLFKSKIHSARVTDANLNYQGSISIDKNFLDASGILPYEKVDIVNVNNGARFTTYVIESVAGSKDIVLNGGAARLVQKGDVVIIIAYANFDNDEIPRDYKPKVLVLDENNNIIS